MTPFRKKSLTAAVLAFSLLISGCRQQTASEKGADTTPPQPQAPINIDLPHGTDVTVEISNYSIECENPDKITDCLNKLQPLDLKKITLINDYTWYLEVSGSENYSHFSRYLSDKGYVIWDNEMNFYSDNEELSKAIMSEVASHGKNPDSAASTAGTKPPYYSIDLSLIHI